MRIPAGHLQLLTEIGYTCVLRRIDEDVLPIFDALQVVRPNHAAGAIGRALDALMQRKPELAIEVLERDGIHKRSNSSEAKAFLLLAYKIAGKDEAASALANELGAGASEAAQRFAALIMPSSEEGPAEPALSTAAG